MYPDEIGRASGYKYANEDGRSCDRVGAELIDMVNTDTKGFCKETIGKLTKDWPGGSYLVLRSKPMVPGESPLIAIV